MKWEYSVKNAGPGQLLPVLNKMGAQGWELVQAVNEGTTYLIFKRQTARSSAFGGGGSGADYVGPYGSGGEPR